LAILSGDDCFFKDFCVRYPLPKAFPRTVILTSRVIGKIATANITLVIQRESSLVWDFIHVANPAPPAMCRTRYSSLTFTSSILKGRTRKRSNHPSNLLHLSLPLSRSAETYKRIFGSFRGILTSDRYSVYNQHSLAKRVKRN